MGKRRQPEVKRRVPPGQYVTKDFPVLSAEPTPRSQLDQWTFAIEGLVREPAQWVRGLRLMERDKSGFWESLSGDESGLEVFHSFTRSQPPGWSGYQRRIDREMIDEVVMPLGENSKAFVCGPTLMVEAVADFLVDTGLPPSQIRTERFGPTGGPPAGGS